METTEQDGLDARANTFFKISLVPDDAAVYSDGPQAGDAPTKARDYDLSLGQIDDLKPGPEKAIQFLVYSLMEDEGHHKQWYTEQALIALGVDLADPHVWLERAGYGEWEPGIAP